MSECVIHPKKLRRVQGIINGDTQNERIDLIASYRIAVDREMMNVYKRSGSPLATCDTQDRISTIQ